GGADSPASPWETPGTQIYGADWDVETGALGGTAGSSRKRATARGPYRVSFSRSTTERSSITSNGHSAQSCAQQTIRSQPAGSWPWSRKLLLTNSNSIRTRCQRLCVRSIHRLASQSG